MRVTILGMVRAYVHVGEDLLVLETAVRPNSLRSRSRPLHPPHHPYTVHGISVTVSSGVAPRSGPQ